MEEIEENELETEVYEEEEKKILEEEEKSLHKEISDAKKEFNENAVLFKKIFLEGKEEIYNTLLIEIKYLFQEYESEHYNSLVLYSGRVFEFIIYQVGWLILKDAMYKFQYLNKDRDDNIKTFSEIINEIKGFFRLNTGSDHKNVFKRYRKYITDKRNNIAHPSYYGEVREVDPITARETVRILLNAFNFLINKFEEIFRMKEPPMLRLIEHE